MRPYQLGDYVAKYYRGCRWEVWKGEQFIAPFDTRPEAKCFIINKVREEEEMERDIMGNPRPIQTKAEALNTARECVEEARAGDGEGGAKKMDVGKAPVAQGVLGYFARALAQVSFVSDFGAQKYDWNGWENVPDGVRRYENGMGRHVLDHCGGEMYNPKDGGLPHLAQVAWNALAALELRLRDGSIEMTRAMYVEDDEGLVAGDTDDEDFFTEDEARFDGADAFAYLAASYAWREGDLAELSARLRASGIGLHRIPRVA